MVIENLLPEAGGSIWSTLFFKNMILITMLFKSADQVLSDHLSTPALDIMALNKMNQLPIFKQGYRRR